MKKAIREYRIEGVSTTLPFGSFVFDHDAFLSGQFDTHFVKNYYSPEKLVEKQEEDARIAAMVALRYWMELEQQLHTVENKTTSWKRRLAQ